MATPYTSQTQPMMNQPTGNAPSVAPPSYVPGQSQPNMGQPQQQPQSVPMQPMQPQMTGGGDHQRGMSMYGQPQQTMYPPQQQQMGYQPTNYYEQKGPAPPMQGYQPGMQQQPYMQPGFQQPQFVQQPQFMQPQFTGAPVQQPVTNVININNGAPQAAAVVPVVYACANGHTPYTPVPITGILWAVLCFPIGLICLFSEMQTRCSVCGALL